MTENTYSDPTLLIVEDNKDLNLLVRLNLEESGYNVHCAFNGQQAIDYIKSNSNIFLISDFSLPDISAKEIILNLEELGIKIPFIVMTGHGDEKLAVELMQLGALDYVVKDSSFLDNLQLKLMGAISKYKIKLLREEARFDLEISESKYRNIFNNILDIYIELDNNGVILEVSPSVKAILGVNRENIIGIDVSTFKAFNERKKLLDTLHTENQVINFTINTQDISRNKKILEANISLKGDKFIGTLRDITEKRNLEIKITNSVINTQENERKIFAENLHDGLGPLLSSIKLYLSLLKSEKKSDEEKKEILKFTSELLDESISTVRTITDKLTSNVLNDFGLKKAIESFCKNAYIAQDIIVKFDTNINDELKSTTMEIVVYRTIVELINNTLKHAKATKIGLSLQLENNKIEILYQDNGIGFDIDNIINNSNESSNGLRFMINRIKSLNGNININRLETGMKYTILLYLN